MLDQSSIALVINARPRDLGGFSVRRLLPYASHRMVGPFIFFDHMGSAYFAPGLGMDVRPHPHINLATVTYLFEGRIHHRDSLGSDQIIEPGAINWMTAGRGIVHSERTPDKDRADGQRLNGIQLWVALPEQFEEMAPSFIHHPAHTLPEFNIDGANLKLLLGSAFGKTSPVQVHSDLFYIEVKLQKNSMLRLPPDDRESALYVVNGQVAIEGQLFNSYSMVIPKVGKELHIQCTQADTVLMLLGGKPLGHRHIFWNFVSSSQDRIAQAKLDWSTGPHDNNNRFRPIPNDQEDFTPLPS